MLGKTKRTVGEIGYGGWAIGGDVAGDQYAGFASYGPSDDALSRAAIKRALEIGVTLFDTADVFGHGHSETLIGETVDAFANKAQVTIVTKGGINFYRKGEMPEMDLTPYAIANAVQHSRARLKREMIDVYLLMNPPVELLIEKEYIRKTLESLQNAGHIGAFGISAACAQEAADILRSSFPLDVIELPVSLFDQSALLEALPLAKQRGVGVLAREPLANGFLTGKYTPDKRFAPTDMRAGLPAEYRDAMTGVAAELAAVLERPGRSLAQAALRYLLDEDALACVITGMRTPAQVEENAAASDLPALGEDEREKIHAVFFPD